MQSLTISAILIAALLGTPLFIVMGLIALVAFTFAGEEVAGIAVEIYRISSTPTLITIPLFTFAGYLLAESGAPKRLFKLSDAAFGWLPGGVAIVSLMVCAFFTAFTGASGVTIIALGGLLFPILKNEGFNEKFSLGLITTSGSLGLLFPPSLPIILYGLVAKVDIDKLFIAGIIPGLFLILVLSLWSIKNGQKREKRATFEWQKLKEALREGVWEALIPFTVLIAIYGGITTVSEAAALTAFYVLIIECFVYKDLNFWQDVPKVAVNSMSLVGAILLILCCALGLTSYLVDEEVPMQMLELMRTFLKDKYTFLLFLNLFLLVVGALMDIFSAIVVVVPLIVPIANEFGVDPFHLAIIFLTNLEIGYITPPVGINLFISSFRFNKPVTHLYSVSLPFLLLLLVALMIITYWPAMSLALL